jgi:hypothetical protein
MAMYCIIFVELLEKFDSIIENEPQAEIESTNRSAKFAKFKLRMTVGIGFTFTWILARLLVVLVIITLWADQKLCNAHTRGGFHKIWA